MIDLASTGHQLEQPIRLNMSFMSDFNAPPDHVLYSDASGKWGCGALCFPQLFYLQWPNSWSAYSITVTAVALWGHNWSQQRVLCRCDNLQKRSSHDQNIMHLLRSLHFFLAWHDIRQTATHIPGKFKMPYLAITCMQVIHQQAPTANQDDTAIPEPLRELLITVQPD